MQVPPSVPSCWCVHDDHWFLGASIRSFLPAGPATVFVSRRAWNGSGGEWERCRDVAEAAGAEVVVGDWPDESLHRRAALAEMRARGCGYLLIPDGDEVADPGLLDRLLRLAASEVADLVRVRMDTYWKDAYHVIRPREELAPALLLDARTVEHSHVRDYAAARPLVLGPEHGVLHHLSYAGPDERIRRKVATWGHRDEVAAGWFPRVWQGWDADPTMRHLHPTHPPCYGLAERIAEVPVLAGVDSERPLAAMPEVPARWPSLSIVIPLYGGREDLEACLRRLTESADLIRETIVVDDASPDDAPEAVASFPGVTLLSNPENLGFAGTCNRGYDEATGEIVLFLNSDTRVPRAGLIRLIESLISSSSVGASGPMSNNVGYYQAVLPAYTDVENVGRFAVDFAHAGNEDLDVDMLVGFCLAVRRSAIEDTGEAPFDTRFGRGLFEDTDLCYRLQRAGYRLRLSTRAYVHHEGSKSLGRIAESAQALLDRNQRVYEEKWRHEISSGYASHLPGILQPYRGPVRFAEDRHPDVIQKSLRRLARSADITLAMIVRNEERVLGHCLRSVEGIFQQIVIVDTGSTDRTREIAHEHGAEVHEFPWTDSFSEARNESLRHARGRWVFWLDADDTLPAGAAERILQAVTGAPDDVAGFVIPVQFVDDGAGAGTRVDHIKLFRNGPGLRFEGRIHEQILPSLRERGGRIVRLPDVAVLHSGYDTSETGQERKRERDEKLLRLDLEERPDHPFVLFNLGMTAHYTGDHAGAIGWLEQSIAAAEPNESHVRKAHALLGTSVRAVEGHARAIERYDAGLAAVGVDPELLFLKGISLWELGRYEEARSAYLEMPESSEAWFTSVDVGIYGAKRSHNLGLACAASGRYLEARDWWRRALRQNPGALGSAEALFDHAEVAGDAQGMRSGIEALQVVRGTEARVAVLEERMRRAMEGPREGGTPDWATELQRAKAMLASHDPGAESILRRLADVGSSESSFLLGVLNTRRGAFEEALVCMRRSLEIEPGHPQILGQVAALERCLTAVPAGVAPYGSYIGELGAASVPRSIVVVAYNSARTIEACLRAALADLGGSDEMIVVDNSSSDETVPLVETLAAGDPRVRLLSQAENLGYSRAANVGLLASRGATLVLLNPDTVPSPGWLAALELRLEQGYDASGPVSDNVTGDQFAGLHVPNENRPPVEALPTWLRERFPGASLETRLLVGFCLATSRSLLDRLGLLDEATRLGADDLELSWRIRHHGGRLAIAMDAFVAHERAVSFASREASEVRAEVRESDIALLRKLRSWYGFGKVPSSESLWGSGIYAPCLLQMGEGVVSAT